MTFVHWQNRLLTDLSREELIAALAWCIKALDGGAHSHGINPGQAFLNERDRMKP